MTNQYRGKGSSAYQRQQQALKRLCRAKGVGCSNCGQPFDFDNHNSPRGFTADHPKPLSKGGRLNGQQIAPMCRACNARLNNHDRGDDQVILRPAT